MAVPTSEITVIMRGPDLICFAAPEGADINGPLAVELARIKVKMLNSKEDTHRWIQMVKEFYVDSLSRCFDVDVKDFKWVDVTPKGTRQ